MNKAYRTIWNKALGAFVAASELDSSRGKGKSGAAASICDARSGEQGAAVSHGSSPRVLTILLLIGVGGWGAQAQAQLSCADRKSVV